jgi:hypothetical protein
MPQICGSTSAKRHALAWRYRCDWGRAAIEPFLEQAAVVLAPLRVGGGMRMKVLYAMAMGKAGDDLRLTD